MGTQQAHVADTMETARLGRKEYVVSTETGSNRRRRQPDRDECPTLVETCLALAAVCLAIATLVPRVNLELKDPVRQMLVIFISLMAGFVALLAQYGALWLLARYCFPREASWHGLREIAFLVASPAKAGPLWPMGIGLVGALLASVLILLLTPMRLRS